MMRARERAPTFYPSTVFTLDCHLSLSKRSGACQPPHLAKIKPTSNLETLNSFCEMYLFCVKFIIKTYGLKIIGYFLCITMLTPTTIVVHT
jgi:hypothetical protein